MSSSVHSILTCTLSMTKSCAISALDACGVSQRCTATAVGCLAFFGAGCLLVLQLLTHVKLGFKKKYCRYDFIHMSNTLPCGVFIKNSRRHAELLLLGLVSACFTVTTSLFYAASLSTSCIIKPSLAVNSCHCLLQQ